MAGLTGTLLADGDGVYDLAVFNDWLLLGLKGIMAEAELHVLRAGWKAAQDGPPAASCAAACPSA